MKPLNNIEIDEHYNNIKSIKQTCSRDTVPKLKNKEGVVINLNLNSEPGSHWVCLFKEDHFKEDYSVYNYFDSYGVYPLDKKLLKVKEKDKIIFNNTQYQPIQKSNTCGAFCCYVLDSLMNGHDFVDVVYQFDHDNLKNNDKMMNDYCKRFIRK